MNFRCLLACGVIVLAASLIAPGIAGAQSGSKRRVAVTATERIDFAAGGSIHLRDSFGEVQIDGWDEPRVEIEVRKSIRVKDTPKDLDKAERKLETVKVIASKEAADSLLIASTVPFRKGLELIYRIKIPRQSNLYIKHDIGEVRVRDVIGDLQVTNRIGQTTLDLPASERYTIDARARLGAVSSEFGGRSKRSYLLSEKVLSDYNKRAHRLYLRVGIGEIDINKLPD